MRKKSIDEPFHIGAFVERVLSQRGLRKRVTLQRICDCWSAAAGERIAYRSRPVRLRNGVLWISVDSSAWISELNLLKRPLTHQLNQHLGQPIVKEMCFRHRATYALAASVSSPSTA